MAPFNQTAKYIAKIRKEMEAGKTTEAAGLARIAKAEKSPKWVARWTLPNGKEATQVCRSEREAKKVESEKRALAGIGEFEAPKHLKASMTEVFAFYLEYKLKGRASYPNAKPHCEKAAEILASMGAPTLQRFDALAEKILFENRYAKALKKAYPDTFRSESSLFNHRTYVHSAVAYWIKMRRLRIVNPFQIWEVEKPDNTRMRTPTFEEYKHLLQVASQPKYPAWMRAHIVLYWEHGRRLTEHASLRHENLHLNPAGQDLPWIKIRILKRGGKKVVWHEIPITYEAAVALKAIHTPGMTGPDFAERTHTLADWNRKILKDAGLTDLHFHDFRRAYRNRNDAMDRAMRMGLQGKKTEEMDDRYLTEQRKALEPAVQATYSGVSREEFSTVGDSK